VIQSRVAKDTWILGARVTGSRSQAVVAVTTATGLRRSTASSDTSPVICRVGSQPGYPIAFRCEGWPRTPT
jgi:hypothetical protein